MENTTEKTEQELLAELKEKMTAVSPVVKYEGFKKDQILRTVSKKVTEFGDDLLNLSQRLLKTLFFYDAAGISAIQIGVPMCVIVTRNPINKDLTTIMVNPEILSVEGEALDYEGCLSFPDIFVAIKRPLKATIKFQDIAGAEKQIQFIGLEARAALHEIEHTQGKLFIDNMSSAKKGIVLKQVQDKIRSGIWNQDEMVMQHVERMNTL